MKEEDHVTGHVACSSSKRHFVLMNGTVWVAPSPDGYAEYSQCTAQTTRGKRCRLPLDHGQVTGWSWLKVPGGVVEAYDFDGYEPQLIERYLAQRCARHFGADVVAAVEPEWRPFDAMADAAFVMSAALALGVS